MPQRAPCAAPLHLTEGVSKPRNPNGTNRHSGGEDSSAVAQYADISVAFRKTLFTTEPSLFLTPNPARDVVPPSDARPVLQGGVILC